MRILAAIVLMFSVSPALAYSDAELFGSMPGDVLSDGSVVTDVTETITYSSTAATQSSGAFKSVRGNSTDARMRRGPLRRFFSNARARSLERRNARSSQKLDRMASRGVF